MKTNSGILTGLIISLLLFAGCERIFDTDSGLFVSKDDLSLDTPNEVFYLMNGIFHELDKLSEGYVLMGELRGDLMLSSTFADDDISEISDFQIGTGNVYNNVKNYYSVINNCNYLIHYVDTSKVTELDDVLLRYLAAAKGVRAWTYMQLVLNYGSALYFDEALTSVDQFETEYPEYTLEGIIPVLIADLEPYKNLDRIPTSVFGDDIQNSSLTFPIPLLLGELYLWEENYEQAARVLFDYIDLRNIYLDDEYNSVWEEPVNGQFLFSDDVWADIFTLDASDGEQLAMLAGSSEFGVGSPLDSLCLTGTIKPSDVAIQNWFNQTYYYSLSLTDQGDLRGKSSYLEEDLAYLNEQGDLETIKEGTIMKFLDMSTSTTRGIHIYRKAHVYLRYAEAVNRAGNPTTAFAVLKNGLNSTSMSSDSIIAKNEKYLSPTDSTFVPYLDFSDAKFNVNQGIHMRGCGRVAGSSTYRIPSLPTLQDSIEYVEDKILEELALETAFEGNRFHDLMRVSLRRGGAEYLADKVSSKYEGARKTEIRTRLMDSSNWYLMSE